MATHSDILRSFSPLAVSPHQQEQIERWLAALGTPQQVEPYQHHDLQSLRNAIKRRNQEIPEFGHNLGHIPPEQSDHHSGGLVNTLNVNDVSGGPAGIRTPNQGIMSPLL